MQTYCKWNKNKSRKPYLQQVKALQEKKNDRVFQNKLKKYNEYNKKQWKKWILELEKFIYDMVGEDRITIDLT